MKLSISLSCPKTKEVFELLDIQYLRDILPLLDSQHCLLPRKIDIFAWKLEACSIKEVREKIATKLRNSPKEARSPLLIQQKVQEFKSSREEIYLVLKKAFILWLPVFVDV